MRRAPEKSSGLETYHAIFAVDPGNHTGVAWSLVPMLGSTQASMVARLEAGSTTVEGSEIEQAEELWKLWSSFKQFSVGQGIPLHQIHLVVERFTLRGGNHAGGKDGTSPERITWAFEGYRRGRYDTYRRTKDYTEITWQQPSQALTFGTRPRLEAWQAWVKGREHERTAYCHLALKVSKLLQIS